MKYLVIAHYVYDVYRIWRMYRWQIRYIHILEQNHFENLIALPPKPE